MKYNRFLPLIVPALAWATLEIYLAYPGQIYVALVLINLFLFFALWQFTRESIAEKKWWNFLVLPALLSVALVSYTTLLKNRLFIQFLFFLEVAILYLYLRFSYYYLVRPEHYKVSSIENISQYVGFLTFFLAAATVYGLESFLDLPAWILMIAMLVVSALVVYEIIWANNIDLKDGFVYLLVGCLVLTELAWSISFLPLNFNIAGFTLAVFYYMLVGSVRLHLIGALDRSKIKMYLAFGFLSIILILMTARWL